MSDQIVSGLLIQKDTKIVAIGGTDALLGIADQLWKPARHLHENLHRFQIA